MMSEESDGGPIALHDRQVAGKMIGKLCDHLYDCGLGGRAITQALRDTLEVALETYREIDDYDDPTKRRAGPGTGGLAN